MLCVGGEPWGQKKSVWLELWESAAYASRHSLMTGNSRNPRQYSDLMGVSLRPMKQHLKMPSMVSFPELQAGFPDHTPSADTHKKSKDMLRCENGAK